MARGAARQRLRPDAEISDGEVSWHSSQTRKRRPRAFALAAKWISNCECPPAAGTNAAAEINGIRHAPWQLGQQAISGRSPGKRVKVPMFDRQFLSQISIRSCRAIAQSRICSVPG